MEHKPVVDALKKPSPRILRHVTPLALCGLFVGILTGLSLSPIIQGVLSSFVALLAAAASVVVGVASHPHNGEPSSKEETPNEISRFVRVSDINVWPLTAFLMFLTLGCAVGIFVRTNDVLGCYPGIFMAKWSAYGGKGEDALRRYQSVLQGGAQDELRVKQAVGGLFAGKDTRISKVDLKYAEKAKLASSLQEYLGADYDKFIDSLSDDQREHLRDVICASK